MKDETVLPGEMVLPIRIKVNTEDPSGWEVKQDVLNSLIRSRTVKVVYFKTSGNLVFEFTDGGSLEISGDFSLLIGDQEGTSR